MISTIRLATVLLMIQTCAETVVDTMKQTREKIENEHMWEVLSLEGLYIGAAVY